MSGLDILSPRGRRSAADEQIAAQMFMARVPRFVYMGTPKKRPADVDAILTVNDHVCQVVETKCRYDVDIDRFMGLYSGQWLVTHDKIVRAMAVAKALRVGLTGFLYIVPSKTLLVQPLVDASGHFLTSMTIKTTATQTTINDDGKVFRANAFIDMNNARLIA